MMKCPFCHFENEDGALFCEQCKSDLAAVEVVPVHQAQPEVEAPIIGGMETIPLAPVVEGVIAETVVAEAVVAEAVPIEGLATSKPLVPTVSPMPDAPEHVPEAPPAAEAPAPAEPPAPAPAEAAAPAPAAPAAPAPAPAGGLPAGAEPRLLVLRGLKRNVEYPLYEGHNFIGRADEKPVDIDLEDQEPPDRIWSSRQHALVSLENGQLTIEDLNSSNGTFVNRSRIYPGQKTPLHANDVIQIGTVQLKVIV